MDHLDFEHDRSDVGHVRTQQVLQHQVLHVIIKCQRLGQVLRVIMTCQRLSLGVKTSHDATPRTYSMPHPNPTKVKHVRRTAFQKRTTLSQKYYFWPPKYNTGEHDELQYDSTTTNMYVARSSYACLLSKCA